MASKKKKGHRAQARKPKAVEGRGAFSLQLSETTANHMRSDMIDKCLGAERKLASLAAVTRVLANAAEHLISRDVPKDRLRPTAHDNDVSAVHSALRSLGKVQAALAAGESPDPGQGGATLGGEPSEAEERSWLEHFANGKDWDLPHAYCALRALCRQALEYRQDAQRARALLDDAAELKLVRAAYSAALEEREALKTRVHELERGAIAKAQASARFYGVIDWHAGEVHGLHEDRAEAEAHAERLRADSPSSAWTVELMTMGRS